MKRFILAVAVICLLAALAFFAWKRHSHKTSPLVGKLAPAFLLPQLHDPSRQFSPGDMKGKVWLLNIWASWCGECAAEHPVLIELSKRNIVPIYGINYWDKPESGMAWLERHGNPYVLALDGSAGIDYSLAGVPDTYVIDKQGVIQYALVGQLTPEILNKTILPLIAELEKK